MSEVVPLHPCGCCGKVYGAELDLEFDGEVITGRACDECLEATMAHLDRIRPIFEKMIEVGVPNEVANDAMTFLNSLLDSNPLVTQTLPDNNVVLEQV